MAKISHIIDPTAITPDTKLRLANAAELAFPDSSIKASSLRAGARLKPRPRGNAESVT
jgi:hypothetical protein